jgi:tRNA threonylcarbamoyladenosine biosynthesis protein TsaE
LRLHSPSALETRAIARRLAAAIEATPATREMALVIALVGPLGAGKTEWVKGLAEGFGIAADEVASPTFVIASEHAGRRQLFHADLYRLERAEDLDDAGFVDWLTAASVVAIEWADRFPGALPDDRLVVRLARSAAAPDARAIELEATGGVAKDVLARFGRAGQEQGEETPWR